MKSFCIVIGMVLIVVLANHDTNAQNNRIDSLFLSSDTTAVMDSLMKDFDRFLDSIAAPKSFLNISLGIGTGIFSFEDKNSVFLTSEKNLFFPHLLAIIIKPGLDCL